LIFRKEKLVQTTLIIILKAYL